MGNAKDGSLICKVVIILILGDGRQQKQPNQRNGHNRKKCKNAAGIFVFFENHPIRPPQRHRPITSQRAVGTAARMRSEKSGALSAGCATSLIRERPRSSSNDKFVYTRPER